MEALLYLGRKRIIKNETSGFILPDCLIYHLTAILSLAHRDDLVAAIASQSQTPGKLPFCLFDTPTG